MKAGDLPISYWNYTFDGYNSVEYIRDGRVCMHKAKSKKKLDDGSYTKGSPIKIIKISELIELLRSSKQGSPKGSNGSYFFFHDEDSPNVRRSINLIRDSSEEEQQRYTSADFCAVDLDNLDNCGQGVVDTIMNSWDWLVEKMPSLTLAYYSNSGNGLHILIRINRVNYKDYPKITAKANTRLIKVIKDVCGVDIDSSFDPTCMRIAQQHFLNYSKVIHFNENAVVEEFDDEITNVEMLKVLGVVERNNRPKTTREVIRDQVQRINNPTGEWSPTFHIDSVQDVEVTEYYSYSKRYTLWQTLAHIYKPDSDEFKKEWHRICEMLPKYNSEYNRHHTTRYYEIEDPQIHNYQYEDKYISLKMLSNFGYTIISQEVYLSRLQAEKAALLAMNNIDRDIKIRLDNLWRAEDSKDQVEISTYLSAEADVLDNLRESIEKHKSITIKGSTGIGKTTAISRIAKEIGAIIAVPFIAVRDNYEREGLTVVLNNKDVDTINGPCCMTFDRLAMLPDLMIEGRTIFIDESHVLFQDRTYRSNLIETVVKLKRINCKTIFVSATPIDIFKTDLQLNYWKPRPYVNVYPVMCASTGYYLEKLLLDDAWRGGYSRVVVFSNAYIRTFKDNHSYLSSDMLSILHNDYKWTGDQKRISESQLLDSDITLATSLAFNGLNFDNENEKILVVSIMSSTSTAWEFIQQVGRIRKSICDLVILCPCIEQEIKGLMEDEINDDIKDDVIVRDGKVYNLVPMNSGIGDPEQRRLISQVYGGESHDIFSYEENLLDENVYEAEKEISEYVNSRCGLNNILNDLKKEGYFLISDTVKYSKGVKTINNKQREEAQERVKDYLREGLSQGEDVDWDLVDIGVDKMRDEVRKYFLGYIRQIRSLSKLTKLNYQHIYEVIDQLDWLSLSTIIRDIREVVSIWSYEDNVWSHIIERVELRLNNLDEFKDTLNGKRLAIEIKHIKGIRKEYNNYSCSGDVVDTLVKKKKDSHDRHYKKVSDKKKKHYILTNNKTGEIIKFNSRKELTSYIDCSPNVVDRIIKCKSKKYSYLNVVEDDIVED